MTVQVDDVGSFVPWPLPPQKIKGLIMSFLKTFLKTFLNSEIPSLMSFILKKELEMAEPGSRADLLRCYFWKILVRT